MTRPRTPEQRAERAAFIQRLAREYAQIPGAVYIDHFEAEIGNAANPRAKAQHYTGFVEGHTAEEIAEALASRDREHASGAGARILRAVVEQGLTWHPAKIWRFVPKSHELALKESYKNARMLCPICRGEIEAGDPPIVVDAEPVEIDQLPDVPESRPCYAEYQAMRRGTGLPPRALTNLDDGFIPY